MAARICQLSSMLLRPLRGASRLKNLVPGAFVATRPASSAESGAITPGIIESTEEYKFVERLIPASRVPVPPRHVGPAPSGWTPAADSPPALPYMIRRSRMHNIPVYTDVTHGNRFMTMVRKVEGDIWALEKDMREFLRGVAGKDLPTQVNEVTMTVKVKGQFDKELKKWLTEKGF